MSARPGWLERLLDRAVGASRDDRGQRAQLAGAVRNVPADDEAINEWARHARRDRDREIELRVLMSTWM